mmetsp:Transcript_69227/g.104374  ORF Transcript_69227/g.104374 Transcript_69227/m.104374 type:complete len:107 (-) Transcript_69227:1830-2150(-)
MHNNQGEEARADLASLFVCDVACLHVNKELLHLIAIIQLASGATVTAGCVCEDFEIALETLGSFLFRLFVCDCVFDLNARKRVTLIVNNRMPRTSTGFASQAWVAI